MAVNLVDFRMEVLRQIMQVTGYGAERALYVMKVWGQDLHRDYHDGIDAETAASRVLDLHRNAVMEADENSKA
jgi:hypothetical protein